MCCYTQLQQQSVTVGLAYLRKACSCAKAKAPMLTSLCMWLTMYSHKIALHHSNIQITFK